MVNCQLLQEDNVTFNLLNRGPWSALSEQMHANSKNEERRGRDRNHDVLQEFGPAFLTPPSKRAAWPHRPHDWLYFHLRYSSSSSSLTFGFQIQIPICLTVDELIPGHGPRFPTASWMFPSGCKQSPRIQKAKSEPIISFPTPELPPGVAPHYPGNTWKAPPELPPFHVQIHRQDLTTLPAN